MSPFLEHSVQHHNKQATTSQTPPRHPLTKDSASLGIRRHFKNRQWNEALIGM